MAERTQTYDEVRRSGATSSTTWFSWVGLEGMGKGAEPYLAASVCEETLTSFRGDVERIVG